MATNSTTSPPEAALGTSEALQVGLAPSSEGRLSRWSRFRLFVRVWLMKWQIKVVVGLLRIVYRSKLRQSLPTYTKRYGVRPTLENRVFIPADAGVDARSGGKKYPLFIVIHGGGFALMDPSFDDPFNRHMADVHGFVVVSINYRKAPSHRFPTAVHDAAEIARAVLADPDLPVDHDDDDDDVHPSRKVALGGFSAGGNLALAIAQLPGIKEHVQSLVPIYPVVDFTAKYKGEYRPGPDGKPDMLKDLGPAFNWAYIPQGQDMSDPLLSPIYAERDQLPRRIFLIGAEYDILCHEAGIMARKLAGLSVDDPADTDTDTAPDWEKDEIKWRRVPNVTHGWTHIPKRGEKEVQRQKDLDVLYKEIGDWLKR